MKLQDVQPCSCSQWGEIKRFANPIEFDQFLIKINVLVSTGGFVKMNQKNTKVQLFFCRKCGRKWKVVPPDPPYRGFCKKLEEH